VSSLGDDDILAALRVLERVAEDRGVLAGVDADTRARLQRLAGEVARPDLKQRKKLQRALLKKERDEKRARDEGLRASTGIRQLRAQPVFGASSIGFLPPPADAPADLIDARKCYVCKREYTQVHPFYDQLCRACGDESFVRRTPQADLRGKVAVVTGARVKIGYQAALMLLRNGCTVVSLTRFPHDAAQRYAREPDFDDWRDRLHVYGIDLRHTPSVEVLAQHLAASLGRLDHQIHNACQTVRRPPGFYAHLLDGERAPPAEALRPLLARNEELRAHIADAPSLTQARSDADLLLPGKSELELFPKGALDADLQQIDLRTHNSWRLTLGEVPTIEMLEVLLVNAAAPFVFARALKPLMARTDGDKHIVMVSAMEGQFYREHKTDKHPHTNMAKAALNMIVRTSARDYVRDRIHLNAVDTGWVTDEDPAHLAARKAEEHRFSPPLDIIDGAARIVDPIFEGLRTGKHPWGIFFKDFKPTPW
jgi:NAD(P)-dependent dehydrogenase (short-subunit alcohol dehydrogenase family)